MNTTNNQLDNTALHQAEEMFLAGFFLAPEQVTQYGGRIKPDDFYFIKHGWIWEAMLDLAENGGEILPMSVEDALRVSKHLEEVGGSTYITSLTMAHLDIIAVDSVIEASARIIERESHKRRMLSMLGKIAERAGDSPSAEDLQRFAEEALAAIGGSITSTEEPITANALIEQYATILLGRSTAEKATAFVFEWPELSQLVPFVSLGEMILISAFTGIGKSLLAEAMAEHAAMMGLGVFYVSAELSFSDFMDRSAARNTGIPLNVWRGGDPQQHASGMADFRKRAAPWIKNFTFWPGGSELSASLAFRQIKRAIDNGAKFIVVDYITALEYATVTGGRTVRTEEAAIRNFVTRLHHLAKEKQVIIVLVSQLSENARGEAHTRGSKAIEHRATVHIHIRTKEMKEGRLFSFANRFLVVPEGNRSPMRIIDIRKSSFGRVGKTELLMDGECARFLSTDQVSSKYISPEKVQELLRAHSEVKHE